MDERSQKNILTRFIRYVTVKHLSYTKINGVNDLYIIIHKINGWIEESIMKTIVGKYIEGNILRQFLLMKVETFEKEEELENNIRDLLKTKTNNLIQMMIYHKRKRQSFII